MKEIIPRWVRTLTWLAMAVVGGGCTCASRCVKDSKPVTDAELAGCFEKVSGLSAKDIPWEVYATRTDGPPVLLMHDIAGPRPACLELARRLSRESARYKVYVPVFYGKFGHADVCSQVVSTFGNAYGWNFHDGGQDQALLPELERLCACLRAVNGGKQVLVIGNCATGGAGIALMASPDVVAVVASQPALPYAILFASPEKKRSLDVSPATLRRAAERAARLPSPSVLGFRYFRDIVSSEPRFLAIHDVFGRSFAGVELCEFDRQEQKKIPSAFHAINTCNSAQHSVLIDPKADDRVHYPAVYHRLVEFLAQHAPRGK